MSETRISRRKYLQYAGAAVAAGAVGAAGYGLSKYYGPPASLSTTPTAPTSATSGKRLKVRIGGSKPFTGPDAIVGQSEGNGNRLWAKHVNEAGGIKAGDGNTYEVELILYNDEQKPENVGRIYEKLINDDKVDFLFGPAYGPLGMATVPIVEKYRKFEVYGTSTFNPKDFRGWKYIVHVITNGTEYVASILDMIWDRILPIDPAAKNIAITHGDDAFRGTAGSYGYEYAKQKGFNVVFYESYSSQVTDLTPLLTKVKAADPTIYINVGVFTDTMLLVKQMREIDFMPKLCMAGGAAILNKFYETLGKYADGFISYSQWEKGVIYKQDYGPTHDEFVEAYEREYGEPPDYQSATGYLQGLVLQKCMELSRDPLNSEDVRRIAGELQFTTFFGKYKVNPETGWQMGHQMCVIQWQGDEKAVIWPLGERTKPVIYPVKKWSER
ncbi:amino acid ABC transporter substrate-binding protein [Candidatus Bathyarchaeota archaeon]|nr:amino acid ABC transporter substrate-binding protein [Candidatus Bathyarchaeota archaeon]